MPIPGWACFFLGNVMMNVSLSRDSALSGFQWFFFIFCNTVVVPPTLQSAFQLPDAALFTLIQFAFLSTALACLAQAFLGHQRAIMEGPTGLWWGTILTVTLAETARGTPVDSIAWSLAVGIGCSGILTLVLGASGLGQRLARWFSPAVMVVFMLLLGAQLTSIFFKGMLGLPFGADHVAQGVQMLPFLLALAVMLLVIGMIILLPPRVSRYALLVGTLVGWVAWRLCYPAPSISGPGAHWQFFPLGHGGELKPGIILTALLAGIVNVSNTYGALRGTDVFYPQKTAGPSPYSRSFIVSGAMTVLTVPLGVVPFSPFVSSIGLITQTGDSTRRAFVIGSLCCLAVAVFPPLTRLFCTLPLAVSSAVMLVSYLPLLYSSLAFSQQLTLTPRNCYRLALPLFAGIFLMGLPPLYLQAVPLIVRPLLSNGLLVGILLALAMDNLIPWQRLK